MQPDVNLKLRLLKIGMTQVDLARRLGISPGKLNAYINGYIRMPQQIKRGIERVLANNQTAQDQG